jgi:hypothetical protein
MKLHELEIRHLRARSPRHGYPIASGDVWIGSVKVYFSCTTGSKDGDPCGDGDDTSGAGIQDICPQAAARSPPAFEELALRDQINSDMILKGDDQWLGCHAVEQGFFDRPASQVVCV